jgi:hypothetical protein
MGVPWMPSRRFAEPLCVRLDAEVDAARDRARIVRRTLSNQILELTKEIHLFAMRSVETMLHPMDDPRP